MNKHEDYVTFPEKYGRHKLNALYREIPLKDAAFRLLRKYFTAAANLYGIIPLEKLFEIITSQNESLVTEEEFILFAQIAVHECEGYVILGEKDLYTGGKETPLMKYEVIDKVLVDEDIEEYYSMLSIQQGKPFYVPEKKELLAYADFFYCGKTKETKRLRDFIFNKISLTADTANTLFEHLCFNVRCMYDNTFQENIAIAESYGVSFNEQRLQLFAEICQDFSNNVRMQCNRGYTPNEMMSILPRNNRAPQEISLGPNIKKMLADGTIGADELREQILDMDLPNDTLRFSLLKEIAEATATPEKEKQGKIGRNELCPCGSGKKYKRCCGR